MIALFTARARSTPSIRKPILAPPILLSLLAGCATGRSADLPAPAPPAPESQTGASAPTDDVDFAFEGRVFRAALRPGQHFNLAAPNVAVADGKSIPPSPAKAGSSPREIVFDLPDKKPKSVRASLYVCDDENTYCEPRVYAFGPGGARLRGSDSALSAEPAAAVDPKQNEFGFWEGGYAKALAEAKARRGLALLDFSARWCPGCVRLEAETFPAPVFRKAARRFAKAKIDFDRFDSEPLKSRYAIREIPTLLIVDAEGNEVARVADFQPPAAIAEFLRDAERVPIGLDELKARAESGDARASRALGLRLYRAGRFAQAAAALEKEKAPGTAARPELLNARVEAARTASTKDEAARAEEEALALRSAIAAAPRISLALGWRAALARSKTVSPEERAALAREGVAVADGLLRDPKATKKALVGDNIGEFEGLEALYIADLRAELIEAGGANEAEVEAARRAATEQGERLRIPASRRGPSLRLLISMTYSKQWAKAELLARSLLARAPDDPEIQRRLARVLNMQGRHREAVPLGEKARAQSYGMNEAWTSLELAKSYVGAGQRQEARALLQECLARREASEPQMASVKAEMEKLLASLKP